MYRADRPTLPLSLAPACSSERNMSSDVDPVQVAALDSKDGFIWDHTGVIRMRPDSR